MMEHKLTPAIVDVIAERRRQIEVEGFDTAHDDDQNSTIDLAAAASAYAFSASIPDFNRPDLSKAGSHLRWLVRAIWPNRWDFERWFKLKDRRRDLVHSAALAIAAIEKIDRADVRRTGN